MVVGSHAEVKREDAKLSCAWNATVNTCRKLHGRRLSVAQRAQLLQSMWLPGPPASNDIYVSGAHSIFERPKLSMTAFSP